MMTFLLSGPLSGWRHPNMAIARSVQRQTHLAGRRRFGKAKMAVTVLLWPRRCLLGLAKRSWLWQRWVDIAHGDGLVTRYAMQKP